MDTKTNPNLNLLSTICVVEIMWDEPSVSESDKNDLLKEAYSIINQRVKDLQDELRNKVWSTFVTNPLR